MKVHTSQKDEIQFFFVINFISANRKNTINLSLLKSDNLIVISGEGLEACLKILWCMNNNYSTPAK